MTLMFIHPGSGTVEPPSPLRAFCSPWPQLLGKTVRRSTLNLPGNQVRSSSGGTPGLIKKETGRGIRKTGNRRQGKAERTRCVKRCDARGSAAVDGVVVFADNALRRTDARNLSKKELPRLLARTHPLQNRKVVRVLGREGRKRTPMMILTRPIRR